MRRLLLPLLFLACHKPASVGDVGDNTAKPQSQPTPKKDLAESKQEDYQLSFPPGWSYQFSTEEADIFGKKRSFQVLEASWGEPPKVQMTLQARDHFVSGEDLWKRDLPDWVEAVTRGGQVLGEPSLKPVQGKNSGLRVSLKVASGGVETYWERVYLYASGLSRSYVMTFTAKASDELAFTEQRSLLIAGFQVVPPKEEPLDADSCRAQLASLRESGRVSKEIWCLRAIDIPKEDPAPWWISVGAAYDRAGLEAEALDAYQSALSSQDQESLYRARLARGRLLRESQKYQDAAAEYRAALEQKPDSKDATFGLGLSLHLGGDPKGAIALYQTWLTKHPDDHEMKESLALALEDVGAFKDASTLWGEALAVRRKAPNQGDNAAWIEKGEKAQARLKEKAERRGP